MNNCFELYKKQIINKPIKQVFYFFSRPENLELITPDYLNFKIKTPLPIKMEVGRKIDYKIKFRGIPLKWRSEISVYNPPFIFIDEQIRGPYAFWEHTHRFEEYNSNTIIEDIVIYKLPLGIIGKLTNHLFVKSDLDDIFEYRQKMIENIL